MSPSHLKVREFQPVLIRKNSIFGALAMSCVWLACIDSAQTLRTSQRRWVPFSWLHDHTLFIFLIKVSGWNQESQKMQGLKTGSTSTAPRRILLKKTHHLYHFVLINVVTSCQSLHSAEQARSKSFKEKCRLLYYIQMSTGKTETYCPNGSWWMMLPLCTAKSIHTILCVLRGSGGNEWEV